MRIRQIITFIVLVAIFYAILAFNVFHIGEVLVPATKDYVENTTPQKEQESEDNYQETDSPEEKTEEQTGHFSASDRTNLENLCNTTTLCDKISFKGSFNDNEKYNYTKTITKLVQFIDDNGNEEKPIEDVIHTIDISKENGKRRGYATRDSIIFNIGSVKSRKEFAELSTHELGHITDLGYIKGKASKKDKNYTEFGKVVFAIDDTSLVFYKLSRDRENIRKAEAKKKDFCSGYGMSDPFEDFAECFNLYTNHNNFFKQIAKTNSILKKKYNFIASIFDGQYINASTQDLILIKTNTTRRPRDTTKIAIK